MKTKYLKEIPLVKLELAANRKVRERDFWLQQLSGDLVKSNFPFDYKKDNSHEGNMKESAFIFPEETCSRLLQMSKDSDYALNAILLSGLTLLLNKYIHGTDIIIGTLIYNRNRENETGLINTLLPIRTCVEEHLSFKQLLIEVSRSIRQAIDHYNYPMEILAKKLGLRVPGGHFPFFDIVLLLRNIHDKNDIRHISPLLVFDLTRTQESIHGVVKFDALLYDSSTIKQMITHFTHLLSDVLTRMDLPIAQINILTEKEKKHLLVNFNRTAAGYPCHKTLVELFMEQVERTPQSTAVVCVHHHFSYDELNKKANRLARQLRKKGIKSNSIAGMLISPSIEMIAAILGILKAGGAYLPLDPDFPVNRTASMLDDCRASLILTTTDDIDDVSLETINGLAFLPGKNEIGPQVNQGRDILLVDQLFRVFARQHGENPEHINHPTDLAYVMFTSGSTGLPKGTLTEHRNVIRVVKNTNYINLSPADRILQLSNAAFDGSVFDMFGALLNGAALIIVKKENRANLEILSRMIKKEQITVFFVTTALFNALVDVEISCLSNVRKILFGGERISLEHARKALAYLGKGRLIHVYGPTETTVFASYYFLDTIDKRKSTVPIGQPVSHTAIYILDSNTMPAPIGVSGEIHISGTGMSRGYMNRPELTLEKFRIINNKLTNKNGGIAPDVQPALSDNFLGTKNQRLRIKLYKTGDLARWLSDGNIEFLGRIDHQVKIRGFRIEPAEVEYQLLKHERIKEAVVIIRENKDREKYLCAYILPVTTGAFATTSITEELSDYLSFSMARFMIPRYFVLLKEMPLNPSGKVDRRALPEPGTSDPGKNNASPQTLLQKKLVDIWSNVLLIEKSEIGIDSDFFQLGGHSLKATIFISKLHKELNVKIPLEVLFKNPTIRQLAQYISGLKANRFIGLAAVEKKEYYPLSSPQKRLYVLKQMELAGIAYNVPQAYELEGELNRKALEHTFRQLIKRHESLRTYFAVVNAEPVQRVHEGINFKIQYYGEKHEAQSPEGNVPGAVRCARTIKNFIRPFDLSQAPLLRVGLIKEAEQKHILVIDMHHIITDGTSMELFIGEFMALYSGKRLTPLELQYKDYAKWQNSNRQKEIIKKQEKFWLKQFAGELPLLSLPLDYSRPAMQRFAGDVLSFELPAESTKSLNRLTLDTGTTLYMVLLAIFNVFLSKLGGQEEIVVGTPIAGRRNADLERIIGMFVNTLAIKNYPAGDKKFIHFLTEVKERTLEAFENQEYPFEDLVEQVSIHRDTSRNPIFDTMFVLQNMEAQTRNVHTADISQLKIRTYETQTSTSKFDLILSCFEAEEKLRCSFEYCTKLFKKDTIRRFVIYFQQVLSGVVADSSQRLSQIEIITSEEKRRILYGFNVTEAAYPREKSLQTLFAEQAERTPDNTALVGPKEEVGLPGSWEAKNKEGIFVTYKELNNQSHQLAWLLIEKGVRPDTIVGIMVERSVEMIVSVLGILKAGGAYMPIDPDYPGERINYMLADSCAGFLVTDPGLTEKFEKLSVSNCQILMVTEILPNPPMHNNYRLTINTSQLEYASLAYIIYTSGTTGKPKGTLIEHRNVVSLMVHENHLFDFGSHDVWTMFHSYCFDFSVWEMYGALLYGGKLVLISRMTARDPRQYLKILKAEQVTILNQTPASFYQLAREELESSGRNLRLKYVIFGGEALTPAKLKRWKEKYPETTLINMFGITETTVHVTYKDITHKDIHLNISNIGGPLPTLNVYIVNSHRKLLPIGIPGELCVSGAGVCRGYLNQPELTAEKFVHDSENPNNKKLLQGVQGGGFLEKSPPGRRRQKIYKTGDLAKWLPSGNIEYLGRLDHQVKIRGYRVELGDIEAQLMQHYAVKEVAALEWTDPDGLNALNAYVVPDPGYAYPVSQITKLERAGRLEKQRCHEYPNGMTIFYINRYETDFMYREIFEEQSYIQHGITLEEGACIFDVGANIGMFSLFVQRTCKNPEIYAFEPIPPIFEMLSLNTSIYCRNVEVIPYGLSQTESEAVFTYYPHAAVLSGRFASQSQEIETVKAYIKNESGENPGQERLSEDQVNQLLEERLKSTSFTCKMKSLSRIIREKAIEKIDLLKIDVEKAEIDVLNGIDEADWAKIRQLVIEVHDVDGGLENITHLLNRRGYQVVVQQDSELKNTDLYNVYAVSKPATPPGTQQPAIVKKKTGTDNDDYLSPERFIDDLRTFLKTKLPEYMVPAYFVLMDRIPLTTNGKLDRKALPQPGKNPGELKAGPYIPPGDKIEKELARIWSHVLEVPQDVIGIDHNFFELGGHSLKATIMVSAIHKELNVRIQLSEVFRTPTIRELAKYISRMTRDEYVSIKPLEKREYYQLSSTQKRLYLLQQMEPDSTAYNMPEFIHLHREPGIDKLKRVFNKLVQQHESLRTSFHMIDDQQVQRVHDEVTIEILNDRSLVNCQGRGEVPLPNEVEKIINNSIHPFDLSRAPLLRVGLIELPHSRVTRCAHPSQEGKDREYILMIDMHHIISDGVSHEIMVRDFMALYRGEEIPPLRIQYRDFARWQNSKIQRESIKEQQTYWLNEFAGEIPVLNLPTDYVRPAVKGFEGKSLEFEISAENTGILETMAANQGGTLYMVLLAIMNILLSKLSGQEDIIIGSPIAGRPHADLGKIIGMFVNTLALRNYPGGEIPFTQFLKQIKRRTLQAFENQGYPFEQLVENVNVNRDTGRNPLFDVMFVQQTSISRGPQPGNARQNLPGNRPGTTPGYQYENHSAKFDLTVGAVNVERGLFFSFNYSTQLFRKETIRRFISYFKRIVTTVVEEPGLQIGQIEIITGEEKQQLLYGFNDTSAGYPEDKTIVRLFAEQVERTPDNTAVVGPAAKKDGTYTSYTTHISYRELNEKSHRLAGWLIEKGIKPDNIVGIVVERSLEMIIGIIGILKAGGAYLPISPDYPPERINYMLEDSAARILLTQQEIVAAVFTSSSLTSTSTCQASPANLAYVIYTSGSTGHPKGVLIQHFSLVNRLNWMQKKYPLDTDDTLLQKTTYTFDVSVWEILWWSCTGARLYLLQPGGEKDPAIITGAIEKNRVTVIHFVPSMLSVFLEYLQASGKVDSLSCLKQVIVSGEALTVSHVSSFNKIFSKANALTPRLDNLYGPTEATIDVSYFACPPGKKIEKIPIGKPIDNIQLYVINQWYQLQPVGIPGELCIAGHGLARGYLNRPELTYNKFKNNKKLLQGSRGGNNAFSRKEPPGRRRHHAARGPYKRTYKTGDLAKWLPQGTIEFLGRIDNQVKIRGYRIELGEIENQLNRHQEIKESVVIPRGTRDNDRYLCAYIVPETGSTPGLSSSLEQELKQYLSSSLPDYMIPTFFVLLEQIPLTSNGKIDRKQLPEPGIQPGESFMAPANALEETLVDLWSQVLGIEKNRISVDASFFQLGGHSLKASILAAGIYKKLEVKLPLLEIFRNPTVRKLAGILQKTEKTTFRDMEKVEKKEYYPLSFNQKRIFVLHQLVPEGTAYNLPGTFVINHEVKEEAIITTLYKTIQRHESLRTCFKIINDEPVQLILDFIPHEFEAPFTLIDLSAMPESEKQEKRNRVYLSLATTPFDLDRVPLFRSVLLKYHTSHYELMYNMHHIITDGWSMEILRHEFSFLYEVLRNGKNLESQPLTVQYKEFTAWHNKQLKGPEGMKSREYWKKKLEKGIPSFSIPGDFAGKANDYKGAVYSCLLHREIKEQIEKLAEHHQTSVFMVLFTLYLLLLYRFSLQEDIACSIIDAGRQHPALHKIIGFFVNAVIFNITIDDREHFSDFLQRVHHEVMMVFQHQWYPLEQVCEYLKIPYPDVPLSFNMLNQQDASRDVEANLAGLLEHMDAQDVKFELEPYITQYKNVILMHWVYKKNLFQPAFIKYMVDEYIKLVDFFTGNPHQCFKEYQNPGRKAISITKTCAAASSEYTGSNIVREFENQVKKTPDLVAVKSGEEAFTYRELNRYAHQVAHQLESVLAEPSKHAKPAHRQAGSIHELIGLLLNPGFDMAAGIMGILKTGRAYVPLSPDYPVSRLSHILNHSQACLIICTQENKSLAQRLSSQNSISFLELTRIPDEMQENQQAQNPARPIPGNTLAYLLYTSGSTGTPRGVMQNHQNILYFIKNWTRHFSISGKDRLTLLSSFCHDASIPDIFGALLNGATLYPFDIKNREDSMDLAQFLVKERITIWHSVASLFGHFANSLGPGNTFPGLRYVILGGEAVRAHDIHRFKDFFPEADLAMIYGQTESTVNAIWFLRHPGSFSLNRPLLGNELDQTQIFVVDEEGRQVKPYETGEIVVASPYISMGYWRDEASTKKSFRRESNIDKLYYTGDLGRYLPDGTIEFMGRKDWQVKIRGYRIEPGEIESQLLKHPDIEEAVVTARESQTGQTSDRYLCAHLVSRKDYTSTPAQTELREYLSGQIPDYMIPAVFLQLEKMPLTSTGKLDRRALPEPRLTGETGSVAPGTDIEQKVAQTWKDVLKLDQVGIMDSFFSIGGNSVNILQVNSRLRREFNLEIPLVKMFEYPTIQSLSRYLARLCAPGAVDEPSVGPGNTWGQAAEVEEEKPHMPDEQPLQRLEQTLAIIKGK